MVSPTTRTIIASAWLMMTVTVIDGQINRYINPAWLEMDANSEYYPGGEVVGQILRSYGLGDNYGGSRYRSPGYRSRDGGYRSSYARGRILDNKLNNAYDVDPLEYLDHTYDYVDSTNRASNRYRNSHLVPRRTRINMTPISKNTYLPSDYADRGMSLVYSTSAIGTTMDPDTDRDFQSLYRNRDYRSRVLNPRATRTPGTVATAVDNDEEQHQLRKSQ
ncbi:uncharacterized protein LOC126834362 [Adelges cooleyi]|uniref:uncharacterized protein LOC126834362 n=1 Tax=Adelges cooleyi TaxID=133065 RepID=UPI00218010CE|nr:uncharacterized protein LOC126834362 [Adelges cooleyi]